MRVNSFCVNWSFSLIEFNGTLCKASAIQAEKEKWSPIFINLFTVLGSSQWIRKGEYCVICLMKGGCCFALSLAPSKSQQMAIEIIMEDWVRQQKSLNVSTSFLGLTNAPNDTRSSRRSSHEKFFISIVTDWKAKPSILPLYIDLLFLKLFYVSEIDCNQRKKKL